MQPINNVRQVSLTDRVFEELVNGVVSGELAPGDKLTDRRLAEQLGVSRTPIREALQRMVSSGLADPKGRAGWTVAVLEKRDISELFELRGLLEPAGIRRIVREANPSVMKELTSYFDKFGPSIATDRYEEYFRADRSFHSRIVALSRNRRIIAAYRNVELQADLGRHRLYLQSQARVDETLQEHRAIVAAIVAGDLEAATTHLSRHLEHGQRLLYETMEQPSAKTAARPQTRSA